jgi:hypothetical protein
LYDVTVYSPKYSVTMTGVAVGVGTTDGVGVGVGDGVALVLGVGDGVGDAGEYCIASQTPLPLSVYVLPVTTPVVVMLVKIPAVTTGAVHDVTPTPVGVGDGDGDPAADGVGEAVPVGDEAFGTVFPVPPEPLHWASATLNAHSAARASLETPTRGRRGREGCISIAGMAVSVRKPRAARQSARRVYARETNST